MRLVDLLEQQLQCNFVVVFEQHFCFRMLENLLRNKTTLQATFIFDIKNFASQVT